MFGKSVDEVTGGDRRDVVDSQRGVEQSYSQMRPTATGAMAWSICALALQND